MIYIGLGSNLNQPEDQIHQAISRLSEHPQISVKKISSLYHNPPMGPIEQPDFVNAVIGLTTDLSPQALLKVCQEIEAHQGRVRTVRWGPRTIDLDILIYNDLEIDETGLTIPHPGIEDRPFVLIPLQEIAPELVLPGKVLSKSASPKLVSPKLVPID